MFSTLRTRFGIPGVISVIALVFAMFGGAYAASNSSGGGKATASAKAKKGPRGPKGAKGDTGPAGPAGPQGPAGAKGDAGAAGANGKDGTNGTPGAGGTSVTSEEFNTTKDGHCVVGGSKFTAASGSTYACNGEEGIDGPPGPPGPEGSPWTDGGVLPPGESETGTYSFGPFGTGVTQARLPISFPIPVPGPVVTTYLKPTDEPTAGCPGTVEEPKAQPGNLCIYQINGFGIAYLEVQNPETGESSSEPNFPIGKAGALLNFELTSATGTARGNWVVTAPLAG
jgi:Collagen triple helix repeat (20 copies)